MVEKSLWWTLKMFAADMRIVEEVWEANTREEVVRVFANDMEMIGVELVSITQRN